ASRWTGAHLPCTAVASSFAQKKHERSFLGYSAGFRRTIHNATMSPSTAAKRSRSSDKPKQKGQQTKAAIIDAALSLATQMGLEGLSIGALAEVMQMSKSGVFAHFGSREELQISVVNEYHT